MLIFLNDSSNFHSYFFFRNAIKSYLISSLLTLESLTGGIGGLSEWSLIDFCLLKALFSAWSNDLTFLTNLLSLLLSTRGVPSQRNEGLSVISSPFSLEFEDEASEENKVSGPVKGASSLEYSLPWCCVEGACRPFLCCQIGAEASAAVDDELKGKKKKKNQRKFHSAVECFAWFCFGVKTSADNMIS